jgi:hypothetical protein
MFKTILLNFGFAEDSSIAYIPMTFTGKGFKDRAEAILSLAEYLKKKFLGDFERLDSCCKQYVEQSKKFCADCGRNLCEEEFDFYEFEAFLKGLPSLTNDSYGFSWDDSQGETIWTPNVDMVDFCKSKNTLVVISAEKILRLALEDFKGLQDVIKDDGREDLNVILG